MLGILKNQDVFRCVNNFSWWCAKWNFVHHHHSLDEEKFLTYLYRGEASIWVKGVCFGFRGQIGVWAEHCLGCAKSSNITQKLDIKPARAKIPVNWLHFHLLFCKT